MSSAPVPVAPSAEPTKKGRHSKGKQAELFISPRRVENDRRGQMVAAPQISSEAMVTEAAIVQFIAREIITSALAHARENGRVRVKEKDIHHAIQGDAEMREVFPKVRFLHADHVTVPYKPRKRAAPVASAAGAAAPSQVAAPVAPLVPVAPAAAPVAASA